MLDSSQPNSSSRIGLLRIVIAGKNFEFVTAGTFKADGARNARLELSCPNGDGSFLEALAQVF